MPNIFSHVLLLLLLPCSEVSGSGVISFDGSNIDGTIINRGATSHSNYIVSSDNNDYFDIPSATLGTWGASDFSISITGYALGTTDDFPDGSYGALFIRTQAELEPRSRCSSSARGSSDSLMWQAHPTRMPHMMARRCSYLRMARSSFA